MPAQLLQQDIERAAPNGQLLGIERSQRLHGRIKAAAGEGVKIDCAVLLIGFDQFPPA